MKITEKDIETFVQTFLDEYMITPYGVVSRLAIRMGMDKADVQQTIANLRNRKIKLPLLPKGGKGDQLNVDKINDMIDQCLDRKSPTIDPRDRLSQELELDIHGREEDRPRKEEYGYDG